MNTNEENLLHLGCGGLISPHWINVDSSPNVLLDSMPWLKRLLSPILPSSSKTSQYKDVHFMDLRKKWAFENDSMAAIYSSHFLEHLPHDSALHVLSEAFRVLKHGGKARFLLPCIERQVERYLEEKKKGNPLAANQFAEITGVFWEVPKGPWWYRTFFQFYNKNTHKWFYDSASLKTLLEQAGFQSVEVRTYLQSDIPYLADVEKADRFGDTVCLESVKP